MAHAATARGLNNCCDGFKTAFKEALPGNVRSKGFSIVPIASEFESDSTQARCNPYFEPIISAKAPKFGLLTYIRNKGQIYKAERFVFFYKAIYCTEKFIII